MSISKMEQLGNSITQIKRMYGVWAKHQGFDSLPTLWVYCSLSKHIHRSQQEICSEFFIPKQTLSPVCKNLLEEGVIELSPVCFDKREKRIQLTEKGKAIVEPMLEQLQALEDKVFAKLGEEKSQQLLALTQQLSEMLSEEILGEIESVV